MIQDKSVGIIPVLKQRNDFLFLLVHQVAGHWAFPKGHPNANETELETAKRELSEETGLNTLEIVEGFKYQQRYSFVRDSGKTDKEVIFFIGFVNSKKVKIMESEVQSFSWLPFDECMKRLTYSESQKMLKEAYEYIKRSAADATETS